MRICFKRTSARILYAEAALQRGKQRADRRARSLNKIVEGDRRSVSTTTPSSQGYVASLPQERVGIAR